MVNHSKTEKAVSEVIGTIMLLGIAVAIFSVLYIIVLSEPFDASEPQPTIVAFVEGNNIIIEQRGGDELNIDDEFRFTMGADEPVPINIGVALDDTNGDGKWNIGERLTVPLNTIHGGSEAYDPDNPNVDIFGSEEDEEGSSSIFSGTLDIHPKSDIGIKCEVSNQNPKIGTNIDIIITATHYRGDMVIPAGLNIYFLLPDGLVHISNSTNSGEYDKDAGSWILDELGIRGSATLTITAKVEALGTLAEYTQLVLLLDGSGSISSTDWTTMLDGIALALTNNYIPHNGMVELTVIQFGGSSSQYGRTWAQVELGGPFVLNDTNFNTAADNIRGIDQLGGGTAMSCSFRLAADIISGDPNGYLAGTSSAGKASAHMDWPRQVVNLVTDGQPNIIYDHSDRYGGWWAGLIDGRAYEYEHGKTNSESALSYFESLIPINVNEGDEIDAVAVGDETDIPWLRDHIVRPQPGYDTWPPPGPGWVKYVADYTEFANTINEQFELIFSGMMIKADMTPSSPVDITVKVNEFKTILPEE